MRGNYNAYATRKLTEAGEKNKDQVCKDCEEKAKELDEKNGVILTLQKKIERLRRELMNENIELKASENKITDLVGMLAKCQYEKTKCEEYMDSMKKQVTTSKTEAVKTKGQLLEYMDMYEKADIELDEARDLMKKETFTSNKELKKINKELLQNKLIHEKKNCELDETKRTVNNLNTMVGDLQYIVKKLLLDAEKINRGEEDDKKIKDSIKKESVPNPQKKKPEGPLGNAKRYLEFTKRSYDLRQKAREKVEGNSKIDFVFADVNCNLCMRLTDGSFIHFSSEEELNNILRQLDSI